MNKRRKKQMWTQQKVNFCEPDMLLSVSYIEDRRNTSIPALNYDPDNKLKREKTRPFEPCKDVYGALAPCCLAQVFQ